jgi:5-methylcytosine-specific restriction enzyme subunit McrC
LQLRLAEYETTPGVALTGQQRDQLLTLAPSVSVTPTIGADDRYDLTPGSYIGVLRLAEDLEILIRPKVSMARVLFLISYAIGSGRWIEAPTSLAEADSLLEAIVAAFTYRLKRTFERGVLQGYREEEDALNTLRGRWRIGDQVRTRFGIAPPVEVTFDEFSEDIEHNRLLRAALHRLLRLPLRYERSRWPLRALETRLEGVRLVPYDRRRVPQVTFDRRSEHYRPAVGLARLILTNVSFDLAPGGVPASAFLIDMNKVFEDFVVVALREALGVSERVLVQGARGKRLFLDVGQQIPLKPDLSYWAGQRCLFVGDVKYKRLFPAGYPNADLYQLTAYAIATGLSRGMLVYAAGPEGSAVHEIVHLGKRIEVVALDLGLQPGDILTRIGSVASQIAEVARAAA